jgi:predicted metal-dependent hydrolase
MIQRTKELKDHIQYGSSDIDYYIKRSKRIKTSELIVDSDRIEVRTPLNKTLEDTRDIVRNKGRWILRKQKEYRDSIQEIIKPTFQENSTLPYLGQNYHLVIYENQQRDTIEFVNREFVVSITSSHEDKDTKSKVRELYEEWLKRTAYQILKQKTEMYAQKAGVRVHEISVKSSLKSRWASLTSKGSINFNMHLIKAPQHIIDYIVLHEVCHFKIRGHSHRYWALLYRHIPNYQERIDWLNINGRSLTGYT